MKYTLLNLLLIVLFLPLSAIALPKHFVYLHDIDPSIQQEIRYFSHNNFVGRNISGYESGTCILTKRTALALARVQKALKQQKLSLKVYDCYRPTAAVGDFLEWSKNDDISTKKEYYPNLDKKSLFKLGYIAASSGHSRGSTVDLTIVALKPEKNYPPLNMGSTYDFLDPIAHPLNKKVPDKVFANRMLLRKNMMAAGFIPLETEWWHFTLQNEPFPNHYFNFPVR